MTKEHHFEKANFHRLIQDDKIGHVEERLNIIDAFLGTEKHVTLDELMQLLKTRGYDYDTAFVRQCMNRWVDYGFAQKDVFNGQPPRYEHRHLGKHHDHLICTKCGKIAEFKNQDMERLQADIAASYGFHILQHKMEIYGLCEECLGQRRPLMPLAMAKPGERLLILEIRSGRMSRSRLTDLGLRVGDSVEVISNDGQGRLVLGHENTRLAMGRGLAAKIMVSVEDPPQS